MPDLKRALPVNHLRLRWSLDAEEHPVSLSVSRDGTQLAIGTVNGDLLLCDARTGTSRHRWRAHEQGLLCAAFGADVLASGGQDGTLRMWNTDTREPIAAVALDKSWVEHLAWTADGRRIAAAAGKHVVFCDADGTVRWRIAHPTPVRALGFSPSGGLLALAGSSGISLVRSVDGKLDRHLENKSPLLSLAFSPDGKVLACGTGDNTLKFWRLFGGDGFPSQMSGFKGPPFRPIALAWQGKTLTAAGDQDISLWNFSGDGPEGKMPVMLHGHFELVTQLAYDASGKWLASSGRDGGVMLRDVRRGFDAAGAAELEGEASALVWNPRGAQFYVGDASGQVRAYDVGA